MTFRQLQGKVDTVVGDSPPSSLHAAGLMGYGDYDDNQRRY